MANYDFSTLNSADLEELVCDLLNAANAEPKMRYRTFKDGKDKGIDVLASTPEQGFAVVGQVKHYYRTGFDGLRSKLKSEELPKIKELKPERLIVATSVDLSVTQTEEIKAIFGSYIKDLGDIYGMKDLNRLLEQYPEVLDRNYKLWFADTTVLQKLLNSGMEFRSVAFVEHELKKRVRQYIMPDDFPEIQQKLDKDRYIIITGDPGVGKTSLAEFLVYKYIHDDYKLSYILDDIKEADAILANDESRQIIYYDDFLGSTGAEIDRAKGRESSLRKIIKRVTQLQNKILVLTTRKHLFKDAIDESEKLQRLNVKPKESIVRLDDYDQGMKKLMLRFHVEDSDLSEAQKAVFSLENITGFIVDHTNFSPRSVEYITDTNQVGNIPAEHLEKYIIDRFGNPKEIWKHAYTQQLREEDRLFLNTLMTFGNSVDVDKLEIAFNARMDYEATNGNRTREMHLFRRVYSRLEGAFVFTRSYVVNFKNPSLIDFLKEHLREDKTEIERMAAAAVYITQLTTRLFALNSNDPVRIPKAQLQQKVLDEPFAYVEEEGIDYDLFCMALFIYKYITDPRKDQTIIAVLDQVSDWYFLQDEYSTAMMFRDMVVQNSRSELYQKFLDRHAGNIFKEMVLGKSSIDDAVDTVEEWINLLEINFRSYIDANAIIDYLSNLMVEHVDESIEWLLEVATSWEDIAGKKHEINNLSERLARKGIDLEIDWSDFDNNSWDEIVMTNELRRLNAKDD